jgi:Thioredoxin
MKYRALLNIVLSLIGIGLMVYYSLCDSSCSYLRGDFFTIDLKYIGISFMIAIIVLVIFKQFDIIRIILAAGIGVEIFLIAFQFRENVFCPFCLAFGLIVVIMNIINYETPQIKNRWYQKILHAAGEVKIPFMGKKKCVPLVIFIFFGYLFVNVAFHGSATPAYAEERSIVPSYGNGSWELIIVTDYFCPPCQRAEVELKPVIEKLLSRGNIRVTFVDFPGHPPQSVIYAKYFLYAARDENGYENALRARNTLFGLAIQNKIKTEAALLKELKKQGIILKVFDHNIAFNEWKKMIDTYKITQTPTCILKYSNKYMRKFSDSDEIHNGLLPELETIESNSKK